MIRIWRNHQGRGGRKLFFDNFHIKTTTMDRVWHYPTEVGIILANNPGGRPWETDASGNHWTMMFSGGEWWETDRYKYNYMAGSQFEAYAESLTGAPGDTTYPNLGLFEHPDYPGTPTNLCQDFVTGYSTAYGHDSNTTWPNYTDTDPNKKYIRFATMLQSGASFWHQAWFTSPDMKVWSAEAGRTGPTIDRMTMSWDPQRELWIANVRNMLGPPSNPRYRQYFESRVPPNPGWPAFNNYEYDPQLRERPVHWIRDQGDMPTHDTAVLANDVSLGGTPLQFGVPCQIYNTDFCGYEEAQFGLVVRYEYGPVYLGRPKFNLCQSAFLRDGFRVKIGHDHNPFIDMVSIPQHHLYGNVQGCVPAVKIHQGKLRFLVSGRTGIPGVGLEDGGMQTTAFEMRRDGFVSMRAPSGAGEKTLLSTRMRFLTGNRLYINAQPVGPSPQLRCEFVHPDTGAPIGSSFERASSSVMTDDNTERQITFGADVGDLRGVVLRLKIYAQDYDVFSPFIGDGSSDAGGWSIQGRP